MRRRGTKTRFQGPHHLPWPRYPRYQLRLRHHPHPKQLYLRISASASKTSPIKFYLIIILQIPYLLPTPPLRVPPQARHRIFIFLQHPYRAPGDPQQSLLPVLPSVHVIPVINTDLFYIPAPWIRSILALHA